MAGKPGSPDLRGEIVQVEQRRKTRMFLLAVPVSVAEVEDGVGVGVDAAPVLLDH